MIHYQLHCDDGHQFDGWFKDIAAFEKLARGGLVECPTCGGTGVTRALMAPAIGAAAKRKGRTDAPVAPPAPAQPAVAQPAPSPETAVAGPRIPAEMLAKLQRMRAEIEARCDYVGKDFAAEARRTHGGGAVPRRVFVEAGDEPDVRKGFKAAHKIGRGELGQKLHASLRRRHEARLPRHAEFFREGRAKEGDRTET